MLEEERRRREIERQQQQRHREENRQARDYVKFLNDNEESLTKNCFALDEKRSRLEKQLSDLQSKYALSKEVVELEQRKSRAEKELNVTQRKLETIQKTSAAFNMHRKFLTIINMPEKNLCLKVSIRTFSNPLLRKT